MALYGAFAALLFFITFATTKERISPPPQQKTPVWQDLKDLTQNKPWIILFSLALIIMLTITLRGSSGTFYFKYYVGREDLIGAFSMAYMLSLMAGAALTPLMVKFVDKKKLLLILMSLVAVLSALFFFIPNNSISLIFTTQILIGLCLGPKSPLVFSMYADTADYSEWKNGRRATAMIFSAAAFAQKLGGAFAGAMMGWLLGSLGYVANQTQNAGSELGIVLLMTLIPAVFAVLAVLCIWFYPLGQQTLVQVHSDLQRKSNYQESNE